MSNADFLSFLQKRGIVKVEYNFDSGKFLIYDTEEWNCASIQFDEEGNIIND